MRFASLGSGSKGNGTVVATGQGCLLVDCGFGVRDATARLARLGLAPDDLAAILVTHEHGDHVRGVSALARRHDVPVYTTFGTARATHGRRDDLAGTRLEEVRPGRGFSIADIDIMPVAVPHDAREPCQFVFTASDRRLGVLTDLGAITPHVQALYSDCDALVLETNHCPQMLADGPYPPSLKRRVGGSLGHLSNAQAAGLAAGLDAGRVQHLVLSHISEQNNTPDRALATIQAALPGDGKALGIADQDNGFDWLQVN
ncbi:MAG: MBL fold metallo-hydrolase [Alcanivoracaceae bacterium]|nr:MBL fold metallo-hydrolase [Alcanivoracaceae bacterium]